MSERDSSSELPADGGNSVCPGCGRRFECGAAKAEMQCWCMQAPVVITPQAGAGCYCSRCLQGLLAGQAPASGKA